MEKLHVGKIITGEGQHRDAIHIAIAPVVAAMTLKPGQHVGINAGFATSMATPIGVVDPFLTKPVKQGEEFWVMLYPGTITTLRHEWEHPAFAPEPVPEEHPMSDAEVWLRAFASECHMSYDDIVDAATAYVRNGEELPEGIGNGNDIPDEFWDHYEVATGKKVSVGARGSFFYYNCGC